MNNNDDGRTYFDEFDEGYVGPEPPPETPTQQELPLPETPEERRKRLGTEMRRRRNLLQGKRQHYVLSLQELGFRDHITGCVHCDDFIVVPLEKLWCLDRPKALAVKCPTCYEVGHLQQYPLSIPRTKRRRTR